MTIPGQKVISHLYTQKEGYYNVFDRLLKLKDQGLNPDYITMDGERSVIRAMKAIYPPVKIQRCLYPIQREGMRWLRTYPKTQAGKDLRYLLSQLCSIESVKERDQFIRYFKSWLTQYKVIIKDLTPNYITYEQVK